MLVRSGYSGAFRLALLLSGALVLLFIVSPLAGLVLSTPLSGIVEAAGESDVRASIFLTLWVSMASTLIFALISVPFAYLLARRNFFLKSLVLGLINLPVVIPHTAAGIALLGVVSRDTIAGRFASSLGVDFVGAPAGIGIAMAFVSLPFLINAARDGFLAVPERLEKAAMQLGASPVRVFFTISLPLAWRSVLSGLILMFARGLSEFGAIVIIAYHPMVTPVLIYERFGSFGLAYARPVAVIFILVTLAFFILLRILSERKKDAQG